MNRIILVVTKDLRRFWLPLVCWVVVIGLREIAGGQLAAVSVDEGERRESLRLFLGLWLALELLVGYVVAAALVQEDPPAGTRAFWLTRPLGGGRLLAAKLLGCGLYTVAWPVVAALPWHVLPGPVPVAGASEPIVLGQLFAWHACVTSGAIVVAAFTRNLGQLLGWTLGLVVAGGAWAIAWQKPAGHAWRGVVAERYGANGLNLALAAAELGSVVAVIVLYRSRQRGRAGAILGLAWLAVAGIALDCLVR